MSHKLTGVFVRLPLSEDIVKKAEDAYCKNLADSSDQESLTNELLAIGTPVTGGDIPVVTTLGTLRDPVPCVRQSDHLAKLAERDAEIARDSERLDWLEKTRSVVLEDANNGWRVTIAGIEFSLMEETARNAIDAAREVG